MRKKKVPKKVTKIRIETLKQLSIEANSIEENADFRTRSLIATA